MNAPTPSAVSRYLGSRFERSQNCGPTTTGGFTVRRATAMPGLERNYVVVEYEPGTRRTRNATPEGLLKLVQAMLIGYQATLKVRYDVARNDEDGPDEWNCLLVRTRKGGA